MKKLLLCLTLLIVAIGCQDIELKQSNPNKTDGLNISPLVLDVCEGKAWINNVYGIPPGQVNPVGTYVPGHIYFNFNPNTTARVAPYHAIIRFKQNTNSHLYLYFNINNTGWVNLGQFWGTAGVNAPIQMDCVCSSGTCPAEQNIYYQFYVVPVTPPSTQTVYSVAVTSSISYPHTIENQAGNYLFQSL